MSRSALLTAVSALALSGCGTGDGSESDNAANDMAGRTENGQLTARVQGVDLKIDLPPPIRRLTEDDDFLYPGVRSQRGGGEGRRFHSEDPPATVAAWYQDPARAERFSIASATRQGPAFVLAGTARNGDTLRIRLLPDTRGGTDGTLVITAAH